MKTLFLATTLLLLLGSTSCSSVEFYEKAAFSDPIMAMETDRAEAHWHQKVFYSMEGSAGGIGTTAGGGCGCY